MKGQDIMQMLENSQRLDRPDRCPQSVYEVMLRCWSWRYVRTARGNIDSDLLANAMIGY